MCDFYQKRYLNHPLGIFLLDAVICYSANTKTTPSPSRRMAIKGAIFTVFVEAAVTTIVIILLLCCLFTFMHFIDHSVSLHLPMIASLNRDYISENQRLKQPIGKNFRIFFFFDLL